MKLKKSNVIIALIVLLDFTSLMYAKGEIEGVYFRGVNSRSSNGRNGEGIPYINRPSSYSSSSNGLPKHPLVRNNVPSSIPYSLRNAFPPAHNTRYRPSYYGTYPAKNSHTPYSLNLRPTSYNFHKYGNIFGKRGLPGNTYISNDYYGSQDAGGLGFLVNALSNGARIDHKNENNGYNRKNWDEYEDRKWRATTQGPYFENKVPGEDAILPASAVIGAATAFGLVTLLPLNVPPNKPLMYCNNTDIMQAQIRINDEDVYKCNYDRIEILCAKNLMNKPEHECINEKMQCDLQSDGIIDNIYCINGTLLSRTSIFCNSTTFLNETNRNEISTILNCYEGQLPKNQASFIPTTLAPQEPATTTEKSLSFGAKAHIFLLNLMGKGDILDEKPSTTTEKLEISSENDWIPVALTIPTELTVTEKSAIEKSTTTEIMTMEGPFERKRKYMKYENISSDIVYQKVPENEVSLLPDLEQDFPKNLEKIYVTAPESFSTTEATYEWMKIVFGNDTENDIKTSAKLEPVPKSEVKVLEKIESLIPLHWVKIAKNNSIGTVREKQ